MLAITCTKCSLCCLYNECAFSLNLDHMARFILLIVALITTNKLMRFITLTQLLWFCRIFASSGPVWRSGTKVSSCKYLVFLRKMSFPWSKFIYTYSFANYLFANAVCSLFWWTMTPVKNCVSVLKTQGYIIHEM